MHRKNFLLALPGMGLLARLWPGRNSGDIVAMKPETDFATAPAGVISRSIRDSIEVLCIEFPQAEFFKVGELFGLTGTGGARKGTVLSKTTYERVGELGTAEVEVYWHA